MTARDPHHRRPFEQADGYRDDFNGASHDDTWNFLFTLREAARVSDWAKLEKLVKDAKDIPYQQFSKEAVQMAAAAGQLEIVKTVFDKGFRLTAAEGAELVENLCLRHADMALPVVQHLLVQKLATSGKAVEKLCGVGDPAAMEIFRVRGEDIFLGGGAFAAALYAGNGPMMAYLHGKGAEIYRPSTAAGMKGAIADFQQKNPQLVKQKGGESALSDIMRREVQTWAHYYAYLSNGYDRLENFREIPAGLEKPNVSLLQLAARAGEFRDVIKAALKETEKPLRVTDLTRKDKNGVSALSILVSRGEEKLLLDVNIWKNAPEEIVPLHAALKELRAEAALDPAAFSAEAQRVRLKELAENGRFTLRRTPKP
jgi:hypothetical protein